MNHLSQTVPLQYDTGFSPYPASDWKAAFADISAKGFTGVEIAVAYPDKMDADAICRCAEENKLAVTTISTGQIFGRDGVFLASPDEALREGATEALRQHILLSARIGRPNVTIGLLRGRPQQPMELSMSLLKSTVDTLANFAAKHGVIVQFEPINHNETNLVNSTYEALDFIASLGNPESLGLLFDAYHSRIEDGDSIAAIKAAAGRITNFHIADSHRGLPGEGEIDFPALMAAAMATGYNGAFTLETLSVPSKEHVVEHQGKALIAAYKSALEILNQGGTAK